MKTTDGEFSFRLSAMLRALMDDGDPQSLIDQKTAYAFRYRGATWVLTVARSDKVDAGDDAGPLTELETALRLVVDEILAEIAAGSGMVGRV